MTRLTRRGVALLGVALLTYLAARVLGTWELYLMALAFGGMTVVAWVLVQAGSRHLEVDRRADPAEPVAGDPLEFRFGVESRWRLPGLHIELTEATGGADGYPDAVVVDDAGLRPRRHVASEPRPARRGVYRLPAFGAVVEDPLGLARALRTCGEPMRLVVAARLEELSSCPLCSDSGATHGGGRRRLPTRDAWEFRGIRPHVPGEPLNRVDWKSTAKTGSLMLREMEADTEDDVTVLLDGTPAEGVAPAGGRAAPADETFETAVVAAGSLAAFTLGSGHAVSLLLPDGGWRELRFTPGGGGRRRLPAALAEAHPQSRSGPAASLPAVLADRKRHRRVLVLVTSRVDEDLLSALAAARRQGAAVSLVHVAGFGEPAAAAGDGAGRAAALAAAGIRYVRVSPGADLRSALSAPANVRTRAARRRGVPSTGAAASGTESR
ncbi:MAG TPA: DUF58 domain-containing protein [Thermoleophilia bacterium]|nr:DUF58 domain-containing protein [Thermoleophilia bacterium]